MFLDFVKINPTYPKIPFADIPGLFYVVHPNVGLRPPSRGIGCLIIQIKEITTTHSLLISHSCLPLRAYINTFTQETENECAPILGLI
jgi:hypothetical protein